MNITPIRETAGLAPTAAGPGRILLTIITAGDGSSGTYPAETLQRAAEEKAFPRGTQGHIDHYTLEELAARPAGSLKNLAMVLDEDAFYVAEEQALKAHAVVGRRYRDIVEDYKDFIGASISAGAMINEDRVVEQIVPSWKNRVDLVTTAGRGGKVDQVLEAIAVAEAKAMTAEETTAADVDGYLRRAVIDTHANGPDEYAWVLDHNDEYTYFEKGGKIFRQAYTLEGVNVTLQGEPEQVLRRVEYDPINSPADPAGVTENRKGANMATIDDQELSQLREDAGRVAELERQLQEQADERAKDAKAARVTLAEAAVKKAFGDDAPAFYTTAAKQAAEAEEFDAEAFELMVTEAAAARQADNGAGEPNVGGTVPHANESKREFKPEDTIAALEGKN